MLFRPEEIHATSTPGAILRRTADFAATISNHRVAIGSQDATVLHLNMHRFTTIQTGGCNVDRFTRKQPADCQRFEASLGKPLLLPVDGDAILRWQIVKRRKGDDVIGIWMHPGRMLFFSI